MYELCNVLQVLLYLLQVLLKRYYFLELLSDWTRLHSGQVRSFLCLQSHGQTPGEVRSSVFGLGMNTEDAYLETSKYASPS